MRMHTKIAALFIGACGWLSAPTAAADEYETALQYFADRAPFVIGGDDAEATNNRLWKNNLRHYGSMSYEELMINYWEAAICPKLYSWARCQTYMHRALDALGDDEEGGGKIPMV